jgi:hypothetical protein
MDNTLRDDLALLAAGEYGDLSDAFDAFLKSEVIFRKHRPHLQGRALTPQTILHGLRVEIKKLWPEAEDFIESLAEPMPALVGNAYIEPIMELLNDLCFFLRDIGQLPKDAKPCTEIQQVLEIA